MNKFSIAGMLNCLVMATLLALITPSASWADDHMLSVNSGGGVTVSAQMPAVINESGFVTSPLTFTFTDPPPSGNTTTVVLGTSQTLTVVHAKVKLCKPGTNINKGKGSPIYQLEWLDQGETFVGVTTGTTPLTSLDDGYRLTLTMTGISDTYSTSIGSCSVSGQKTYTYTGGATLDKQSGENKLTSTYNFWYAPTNGAPEPGTVLLMLMGLLVLGWTSMKRMRTRRGISA